MKINNGIVKAAMLTGISFAAMGTASQAFAQDATDAATAAEEAVDEDVIVVTATKRETTLAETPIAVSVASGDKLEKAGVADITQIGGLIPSLRVGQLQSSANTNFIIRGFGNGANNPGIEPSVGVFVDGVYRSRAGSAIGDLPNVKRIEVLRGPQSTLFGKNASVGVISIVTAEPKYTFGGSAELSYGNYNAIVAKGNVTGPISDKVAFSLGGGINKRDGYATVINLNEKTSERDRWWTRGQLLFEPSESIKLRLIGDYEKIDENCCTVANIVDGPTGNIVRALGGQINSNNRYSYDSYLNFNSTNKIDNYGVSMQGDFELGQLGLTSITAYRKGLSLTNQDSDFTSADLIGRNFADRDSGTFTQEFRLASDFDGPLNFMVGGFYMKEDISQDNQLFFGTNFRNYADQLIRSASGGALNTATLETVTGNPVGTSFHQTGQGITDRFTLKNDSLSFFGTVDFEITDRLTFTGGVAYNDDKKTATGTGVSTDKFSAVDFDGAGLAGFRQTLLTQGAIAQGVGTALGLGRSATAAEVTAFATGTSPAGAAGATAYATTIAPGAAAFAAANVNNPAQNPLRGLKALQFLPPFLGFPNSVEDGKSHDNAWSYSARLAYKVTDSLNVYGSYATGFKATSWNLSRDSRPFAADFIPGSPGSVPAPAASRIRTAGLALNNLSTGTRYAGPEESEVKEFGLKGNWDQASFNITFFDQKVKGFQDNVFIGTGFVLSNAGVARTKGIEFDGLVRPTPELTLSAAFTYLDAQFESFPGCQINGAVGDCTGLKVPNVSELSTTFGANYTRTLSNGSSFYLNSNVSFDSPTLLSLNVPGGFKREPFNVDATAGYKLANGLEFAIWGRNLTNSRYNIANFPSVVQNGSVSGYPNEPRTYGGVVRYKF